MIPDPCIRTENDPRRHLPSFEVLDHRRQSGVDGAGEAVGFSETCHRAVHVIDLGPAALHQILPHRSDGPRAREDAIDQGYEVLIEADAISARHGETLVDDL